MARPSSCTQSPGARCQREKRSSKRDVFQNNTSVTCHVENFSLCNVIFFNLSGRVFVVLSSTVRMAPTPSESAETLSCTEKKFVPNCMILSSAFPRTPLPHHFLRPLMAKNAVPEVCNNIYHNLHNQVLSSAEKFSRFIHSLSSQIPVVEKFLSFSSDFHSFCHQVRCRNSVNPNPLASHNFAAVLPGDSVAGIVAANGIMNFLNIYNTVLVVRLVLTWFPNAPPAIVSPLSTLCDPYLNIFRGIIPPLGGTLDLSPILAFLVLNAFTSAAAALPCELPVKTGQAHLSSPSSPQRFTDLPSSQKKWMRRLSGNREKSSNNVVQ